jgi:hypothetical protein
MDLYIPLRSRAMNLLCRHQDFDIELVSFSSRLWGGLFTCLENPYLRRKPRTRVFIAGDRFVI